MANTKVQLKAEKWIVAEYLPKQFNQCFKKKQIELKWGGKFEFDAVSEDGMIIANISTSNARTVKGKPASGKFHKIKGDTLYLLHTNTTKRLQIFTEKDMQEHFISEKKSGRFPPEVDLIHVELPEFLKQELQNAKHFASQEVSPNK